MRLGPVWAFVLLPLMAVAQQKEVRVTHHAHGTFTVKVAPLTPAPAEGVGRFSIDKEIHGDLEATTKGEMFSGGDPKAGAAGKLCVAALCDDGRGRAEDERDRGPGIRDRSAERHCGYIHDPHRRRQAL